MLRHRQIERETAPRIRQQPILGPQQAGPHRIQVDVITGRAQVTIAAAFDQLRLIPTAQDMAGEFVPVIEPEGVGALQPGHADDQIGLRRFQNQVIVVAHQAIRMDLPIGLLTCLRERLDEILPVHVIQIDRFPTVASAHHVVHGAGVFNAELSWHGEFI